MVTVKTIPTDQGTELHLSGDLTFRELPEVHAAVRAEARLAAVVLTDLGSVDLAALQFLSILSGDPQNPIEIRGDAAVDRFQKMARFAGLSPGFSREGR